MASNQFDISKCGPDAAHNSDIQVGDFNGDGRPDLLCKLAAAGGGSIPYVQLAGADSYSAWAAWRTNTVEPACSFDLVADLNGDGLDDWLCAVLWQGRYETFYFHSNGSNFSSVGYMVASVAASALDLNRCRAWFVADVNGDGRDDVLCHYLYPNLTSRTLVAMDDGAFTHNWDAVSPLAAASSFRLDICGDLDSGDVDGNGELDWICFYEYPDGHTATFVQLAQGGSYSSWRRWSPSATAGAFQRSRCHYFHVVDVDGDGLADRLCMYQDGNESGILVQTDGPDTTGLQFGAWESWFTLTTAVLFCRDFDGALPEVIDVNGDGLSDILCAYRYSASFMITWIQGSSGSDYGPWEDWSSALDFDLALCDVFMAADVNRDQHTDLICAYRFADGSTATYVQRVELYRTSLPIVIR